MSLVEALSQFATRRRSPYRTDSESESESDSATSSQASDICRPVVDPLAEPSLTSGYVWTLGANQAAAPPVATTGSHAA